MRILFTYIAVLSTVLLFSVSFGQLVTPEQRKEGQRKIEERGLADYREHILKLGAELSKYYKNNLIGFPNIDIHVNKIEQYARMYKSYITNFEQYTKYYRRYLDIYYPNNSNLELETKQEKSEANLIIAKGVFNKWNKIISEIYDPILRKKWPRVYWRTFPEPQLPKTPGGSGPYNLLPENWPFRPYPGQEVPYNRDWDFFRGLRGGSPK